MKYKHIIIKGKVQGVGYRCSAKSKAKTLKIKGTVENLSTGNVEIFCYGSDNAIKEYINYLEHNPGWSNVDNIYIENIDEQTLKEKLEFMNNFEII